MNAFLRQATKLAHQHILIDGHIDFPWQVRQHYKWIDDSYDHIPVISNKGDFDVERAKAGGLSAAFMAIYIAASFQDDPPAAKIEADTLIDMVKGIIRAHPDVLASGDSPEMIETNFSHGLISLPMGLENGAPLMMLHDVQYFYDRGIRYVTLTHAKDNHICDSSYDTARTWHGLSPYGKEIIAEMNKVGMIIDVSHISDEAFYQVMEISVAPVLATHSSCRHFTPGWERNMGDDMIRLLAQKNGVIQINFGSDFLQSDIAAERKERKEKRNAYLEKSKKSNDSIRMEFLTTAYDREHPDIFADVSLVADHIDHVRQIAGIDFIGIGSDFDGLGDSLPSGLKDVSQYPNLIAELLRRGYSEDDIIKICYRNVWRVWNKVNEIAKSI